MTDQRPDIFRVQARSEWVRLETLNTLRWLAITGQASAVIVGQYFVGLDLPMLAITLTISASILLNLFTSFILPKSVRLTEMRTMLMLIFDLIQLICLLFLTGGLSNPFALLVLAPVTISATALTLTATAVLALMAIVSITLLTQVHLPLSLKDGTPVAVPELLQWGNWLALIIGTGFLAGYARRVTAELFSMSQALSATQMALDREHKLTVLDGVVAAAAHEMGTPLATIKLVATELAEELRKSPELKEDAELIAEQANRLGQILKDMGRTAKQDSMMHSAPLLTLVEMAAEPHQERGITIEIFTNGRQLGQHNENMPMVKRTPEVMHGLRNLIQNAVDFAHDSVFINLQWTDNAIRITVLDDGQGFPSDMLNRVGDPFVKRPESKKRSQQKRPEYQGLGLGLFIAKTLLERTGARTDFANAKDSDNLRIAERLRLKGAIVTVSWRRSDIEAPDEELGPNQPVQLNY